MVYLNIEGALGHFGYSNIPEDLQDAILLIVTQTAYQTAVKKAPVDPLDPPVHIKDELKWSYSKMAKTGAVWVRLPYANVAEYGSRKRLAHPFMRPAWRAGYNKMRAVIRKSTKDAIKEEKS